MANCSDLFLIFNENISLKPLERQFLRKARTAVTNRIVNKFSAKSQIPPIEFKVQGSYTMDTIIRPLNGEFDIDIGIHFTFTSSDKSLWPVPQTVSKWVYEAVKNHTSSLPINKTSCVRVSYKPTTPGSDYGYHVDLPIYGEHKDSSGKVIKVIGMNDARQWNEKSDPLAFTEWFNLKCLKNESDKKQLVRLVKYLKAWKDFQNKEIKMPSGIVLTVLAAKKFIPDERDDVSFYKTLDVMYFDLYWGFWVTKPVPPENNLVAESVYSTKRKEFFMERLKHLRNDARTAVRNDSTIEAATLWKKHLGERFPGT